MSLLSELQQAFHEIVLEKPEQKGRLTVCEGGERYIQMPWYEMDQNLLRTVWHQVTGVQDGAKISNSSTRSCQYSM